MPSGAGGQVGYTPSCRPTLALCAASRPVSAIAADWLEVGDGSRGVNLARRTNA